MIISTAGNTPSSLGDLVCAATSFDDVGSRFTQFMIEVSYFTRHRQLLVLKPSGPQDLGTDCPTAA